MSDDRKWFRSSKDGERGFLVERDGQLLVQLDRPNEEVLRNYNNGAEWIPDVERRPLALMQVAKICFEADKELCRSLGLYQYTRKNWLDLSDKERIAWMEKGPQKTPERKMVWTGLMMMLEPLTR